MSSVYQRGRAELQANLTPMIDVTFLLIVFFVLVSQIVEVESVKLKLPELTDPAAEMPGEAQRAVINVVPGAGGAAEAYRLGPRSFDTGAVGLELLTQRLTGLLRANPALRINLRADQRTQYQWVEPVLEAVSTAAGRVEGVTVTPRVNLVVVREE
jgi:biopolymer transport protein ExbD